MLYQPRGSFPDFSILGHVKKRQKSSKSVKKFFDTFRQFSRRAKNVKNRQKVSKSFSTLFDNFRAAPFFRPLLQSAEILHLEIEFFQSLGPLGVREAPLGRNRIVEALLT